MKTFMFAAVLLALATPAHAAPKGEWFLIFDMKMCSRFGCARDIAEGGKPEYDDVIDTETYATRKQCLVTGRELLKLAHTRDEKWADDPRYLRAMAPYQLAPTWSGITDKVTFRCMWHR